MTFLKRTHLSQALILSFNQVQKKTFESIPLILPVRCYYYDYYMTHDQVIVTQHQRVVTFDQLPVRFSTKPCRFYLKKLRVYGLLMAGHKSFAFIR